MGENMHERANGKKNEGNPSNNKVRENIIKRSINIDVHYVDLIKSFEEKRKEILQQ